MCLKNKIAAAALCALIAGVGIFGVGGNNALAQTGGANTDQAIAQMMQMIESLKQQIQQIIQLIAQLKPQETCGNGICRFGETATNCAADCQTIDNCIQEGKWGQQNQKCCQGLTANYRPAVSSGSIDAQGLFICHKCGDGICSENELPEFCAKDCDINLNPVCGNKICEKGEADFISDPSYKGSCPADCGNPASDNGKAKCSATGGVWKYSDCASDCIYNTEAERLAGGRTCAKICLRDFICECASDKYWASREEGCTRINETCGNGTCRFGETATNCPADCPATANKTCSDLCKSKGYIASRCNMWSTGTLHTASNVGCKAGEFNLGWTSDCTPNRTSTGGRACCCEAKTPTTIIVPEICLKPLGSTTTAAQKEACAKANGQIVCSNQCNYTINVDANHLLGTLGSTMQPESPGTCPAVTSCYCACGQSGNNNGNVQTATEGPSWEGTIPAIDVKKLGANLSQTIETIKSILDKLILQK